MGEAGVTTALPELGLVHSATPALVERVAHYLAEGGATQRQTLERLRKEHGLNWGVKRMRQVSEFVATAMEDHRLEAQAEQVLHWLEQGAGVQRAEPACAVRWPRRYHARLADQGLLGLQVATPPDHLGLRCRRRRLGPSTWPDTPESGQGTMSKQLTELLREVLRCWQGPLPR